MQAFTFLELILDRWKLFLTIVVGVTLVAGLISFLLLMLFPTYETTVELIIKPDKQEQYLAEEASPYDLSDPIRTLLCTYSEMLTSWNICGKVVDNLLTNGLSSPPKNGVKLWYEKHITPVVKHIVEYWFILNSGEFKGWPTREEALTKDLHQGITVDVIDNTYFLVVTIEGDNPIKVTKAASALGDVFADYVSNGMDSQLAGVIEKLHKSVEMENKKLEEAEEKLAEFKKNTGEYDMTLQMTLLMKRLEDIKVSRLEAESRLKSISGQIEGLKEEAGKYGEMYLQISGAEISPEIASDLEKLRNLEKELAKAKLEPDDSESFERLSEINMKINPIKTRIRENLEKRFSRELAGKFPQYEELAVNISNSETELYAVKAQIEELKILEKSVDEEIRNSPDTNKQLIDINRDIINSMARLKSLNENLEDAELARIFNVSSISVADPPRFPKYPSSPKMVIFTFVGFLVGLIFAGAVLLIGEFIKGTVNTIEDCVEILESPNLVTIREV